MDFQGIGYWRVLISMKLWDGKRNVRRSGPGAVGFERGKFRHGEFPVVQA